MTVLEYIVIALGATTLLALVALAGCVGMWALHAWRAGRGSRTTYVPETPAYLEICTLAAQATPDERRIVTCMLRGLLDARRPARIDRPARRRARQVESIETSNTVLSSAAPRTQRSAG